MTTEEFFAKHGVPQGATITSQTGHTAKIIAVSDDETWLACEIIKGVPGDDELKPGYQFKIPMKRFLPAFLGNQGQG